ncbi:hypothetical protein T492DRAFT_1033558 [Pavlovales sp. CCMP2436]|nr:hypothetical protein T492DRAFT_1033558 [Pavlovales sp. CCMP2436]
MSHPSLPYGGKPLPPTVQCCTHHCAMSLAPPRYATRFLPCITHATALPHPFSSLPYATTV